MQNDLNVIPCYACENTKIIKFYSNCVIIRVCASSESLVSEVKARASGREYGNTVSSESLVSEVKARASGREYGNTVSSESLVSEVKARASGREYGNVIRPYRHVPSVT